MPSTSQKQHNLMQLCSSSYGQTLLGKKCPSKSVAKDFTSADKANNKFQHRKK